VWGDGTWMHRFDDWPIPPGSIEESPRMIEAWPDLTEARRALDAGIVAFAERLTQPWLDTELSWFSGSQQKTLVMTRGLLVTHMFNHQAHHRGQAHAILTGFGAQTGDTDLPFVL